VNGQFRTVEKVYQVVKDLKHDLLRNDMALPEFDLFVKSNDGEAGGAMLDPSMTLQELKLTPDSHIFVQWKAPMAVTTVAGWYLVDDA
jgi:hypothetical protein